MMENPDPVKTPTHPTRSQGGTKLSTPTPLKLRKERCPCNWANCKEFQKKLIKFNHVLAGSVKVSYLPQSSKHVQLRRCVERHLNISQDVIDRKREYRVAKHHWPIRLAKNMGYVSVPISEEQAKWYGIVDEEDRFDLHSLCTPVNASSNNNNIIQVASDGVTGTSTTAADTTTAADAHTFNEAPPQPQVQGEEEVTLPTTVATPVAEKTPSRKRARDEGHFYMKAPVNTQENVQKICDSFGVKLEYQLQLDDINRKIQEKEVAKESIISQIKGLEEVREQIIAELVKFSDDERKEQKTPSDNKLQQGTPATPATPAGEKNSYLYDGTNLAMDQEGTVPVGATNQTEAISSNNAQLLVSSSENGDPITTTATATKVNPNIHLGPEACQIIEELRTIGKWPVKHRKAVQFNKDSLLRKLRFCKDTAHTLVPCDTADRRQGCTLCSSTKYNRKTSFKCSVCDVPLCRTSPLPSDLAPGRMSCAEKWHVAVDLEAAKKRFQEHLRARKEKLVNYSLSDEETTTAENPQNNDVATAAAMSVEVSDDMGLNVQDTKVDTSNVDIVLGDVGASDVQMDIIPNNNFLAVEQEQQQQVEAIEEVVHTTVHQMVSTNNDNNDNMVLLPSTAPHDNVDVVLNAAVPFSNEDQRELLEERENMNDSTMEIDSNMHEV